MNRPRIIARALSIPYSTRLLNLIQLHYEIYVRANMRIKKKRFNILINDQKAVVKS